MTSIRPKEWLTPGIARGTIYAAMGVASAVVPDLATALLGSVALLEFLRWDSRDALAPVSMGRYFRVGTHDGPDRKHLPGPMDDFDVMRVWTSEEDGIFDRTILPDLVASGSCLIHLHKDIVDEAAIVEAARRSGRSNDLYIVDLTGEKPRHILDPFPSMADKQRWIELAEPLSSYDRSVMMELAVGMEEDGFNPVGLPVGEALKLSRIVRACGEHDGKPSDLVALVDAWIPGFRKERGENQSSSFRSEHEASVAKVERIIEPVARKFDPQGCGEPDATLRDVVTGRRILVVRLADRDFGFPTDPSFVILSTIMQARRSSLTNTDDPILLSLKNVRFPHVFARHFPSRDCKLILTEDPTMRQPDAFPDTDIYDFEAGHFPLQCVDAFLVDSGAEPKWLGPSFGRDLLDSIPNDGVLLVRNGRSFVCKKPEQTEAGDQPCVPDLQLMKTEPCR